MCLVLLWTYGTGMEYAFRALWCAEDLQGDLDQRPWEVPSEDYVL